MRQHHQSAQHDLADDPSDEADGPPGEIPAAGLQHERPQYRGDDCQRHHTRKDAVHELHQRVVLKLRDQTIVGAVGPVFAAES